jgi:iron uptake system component EfeO
MHTDGNHSGGRPARRLPLSAGVAAAAGLALIATACSSSSQQPSSKTAAAEGKSSTVTISLTSQGCAPKPAKIAAGPVEFDVANKDADGVTEAELRTGDLSKILGEQENLTPGLSGGFSLTIQPGSYQIACPGAAQQHWKLTVTGQKSKTSWEDNPELAAAVKSYSTYVGQSVASLVSHTETMCAAISSGNLARAKELYPKARVYYEQIEPVAEVWGTLDTSIDGRWENPVTVKSKFTGFHRIEQLMWADSTLTGAPRLCSALVKNQRQLLGLVRSAQYNPLEMASGATDLVNEAATSKISGEEERYSNTDLPVFRANIVGAMEVIGLLRPYLQQHSGGSLLAQIDSRNAAVTKLLAKYQEKPGYDDTGYVEYSTVLPAQRRQLATAVNALAEAMSKIAAKVSAPSAS